MKVLNALLFLAFHLLMLLVEKVQRFFGGGKKGEEAFLANFTPDGYFALTPQQRENQAKQSECFQCGLCASLQSPDSAEYELPQQLFVSTTRHLPELELWKESLQRNEDIADEFERLCPAGLSPRDIRKFYEG